MWRAIGIEGRHGIAAQIATGRIANAAQAKE